jgi:hypothetical protein
MGPICIDDRMAGDEATCCGVNLACVQLFGVGVKGKRVQKGRLLLKRVRERADDGDEAALSQNGSGNYFRVGTGSTFIDNRTAGYQASCCGVNLGLSGFWVSW